MADLSGGQVNHGSAQRVASPIASRLGMAMGPQEALASSGMGQAPRPPANAVGLHGRGRWPGRKTGLGGGRCGLRPRFRNGSEEHTSELRSLISIAYAAIRRTKTKSPN